MTHHALFDAFGGGWQSARPKLRQVARPAMWCGKVEKKRSAWRSSVGLEALVQWIEVGQPAGVEIGLDRVRKLGLAGAVVGERKQADHCAAGLLLALLGEQRFERAGIGPAREQLIAVDQIEQRHRLPAWEQDARQLLTASNEGMTGSDEGLTRDDPHQFGKVVRAKDALGEKPKPKPSQ